MFACSQIRARMRSWKAALYCLVLLASLTLGQEEQPSDSLRTAIEAVSRRQRDLAAAGPNYYTGGLSQYRYQDGDARPGEELAFLATPREFAGQYAIAKLPFLVTLVDVTHCVQRTG